MSPFGSHSATIHSALRVSEERAFSWGLDTPTVGVRASVNGKTKRVASDVSFVGFPIGRQARFGHYYPGSSHSNERSEGTNPI